MLMKLASILVLLTTSSAWLTPAAASDAPGPAPSANDLRACAFRSPPEPFPPRPSYLHYLGWSLQEFKEAQAASSALDLAEREQERFVTARWRRLQKQVPGIDVVRPAQTSALLRALREWAPLGQSIVVYDRMCREVEVGRYERQGLAGIVRKLDSIGSRDDTVWPVRGFLARAVVIGERVLAYKQEVRCLVAEMRKWQEIMPLPFLDEEVVTTRALSKVTQDAAWYDAVQASVEVVCAEQRKVKLRCRDGEVRSCPVCATWALRVDGVDYPSTGSRSEKWRCSAGCPREKLSVNALRAAVVVHEMRFVYTDNRGTGDGAASQTPAFDMPYFYRNQSQCLTAKKKFEGIDASVLETW